MEVIRPEPRRGREQKPEHWRGSEELKGRLLKENKGERGGVEKEVQGPGPACPIM